MHTNIDIGNGARQYLNDCKEKLINNIKRNRSVRLKVNISEIVLEDHVMNKIELMYDMRTIENGSYFKIEMFDGEFDMFNIDDEPIKDQEALDKKRKIKMMENQVNIKSDDDYEKLYFEKTIKYQTDTFNEKWICSRDIRLAEAMLPRYRPTVLPNSMLSKISVYRESTGRSAFRIGKKPNKKDIRKILLGHESHKVKLFKVPGMPSRMMTSITRGHDIVINEKVASTTKAANPTVRDVQPKREDPAKLIVQRENNSVTGEQNFFKVISTSNGKQIINLISADDSKQLFIRVGDQITQGQSFIDSSCLSNTPTVVSDVIVTPGQMVNNNTENGNRVINVISPANMNNKKTLQTILPKIRTFRKQDVLCNFIESTDINLSIGSKKDDSIPKDTRAIRKLSKKQIHDDNSSSFIGDEILPFEHSLQSNLENILEYSKYPLLTTYNQYDSDGDLQEIPREEPSSVDFEKQQILECRIKQSRKY